MTTDLRLGSATKLVLWLTVCGVCVLPTNSNLDLSSAISCTLQDRDSQGMGFTSTQPFKMSTHLKPLTTNLTTTQQQKVTFTSSMIKSVASANPSFTTIDWSTKAAPSPLPRGEAQSAVVNGKLYVFGGYLKGDPIRFLASVDVYNSANNRWTRLAKNMPKSLTHSGTAVDGKNVYLAGGYVGKPTGGQIFGTTDVWRYNVDTDTWTDMPPLPQARGGGALEVLGRNLHFFGGSDLRRADKGDHWVLSLGNFKKGWTKAASLPNPRNHLGSAVLGGKLYAIGGQHGQDRDLVTQTSVHMWNAATRTWTGVAPLPCPRSHISGATFVMDGRIIVVGGEVRHAQDISDVTAYNPQFNSWKALTPLPAPRRSGVAGSIENRIFFTTGYQVTTYKGLPVLTFPAQS